LYNVDILILPLSVLSPSSETTVQTQLDLSGSEQDIRVVVGQPRVPKILRGKLSRWLGRAVSAL
jgi:hypothetical protein